MCRPGGPRCPSAARERLEAAVRARDMERIRAAREEWYQTVPGNAELAQTDPAAARGHMLTRKQLLGDLTDPDEGLAFLMDSDEYRGLLAERDTSRDDYLQRKDVDTKAMGEQEAREHVAGTREAYMRQLAAKQALQEYQQRINVEAAKVNVAVDEYTSDRLGGTVKVGEYTSGSREWLAARQGEGDRVCLGGSDIGGVLGTDETYAKSDREEVLASKVVEYTADQEQTFAQSQGDVWEPVIVRDFQQRHPGMRVYHSKATWASEADSQDQVNVDGLLSSRADGVVDGVFEAKTASDVSHWRDEDGNAKVPDGYRAQVLWYLDKTGLDYGYVGVRIDGHQYEEYRIERGEKINDRLGTIADNQDKIDAFRDEVRAARRGEVKAKRKVNPHPDPKASHNVESQIALFQQRDEAVVRAAVAERVAGGSSYPDAVRAEMNAHPYRPQGMVVLDLETTGASTKTGEVIEIAYQKLDAHGQVEREGSILASPDPRYLKARGTGMEEVHGITPRMVRGKPMFTSSTVQDQLRRDIGEGSIIVAHNASFEKRWMAQDVEHSSSFRYLDTMQLSKFFGSSPNNTLESFAGEHGVDYENAHRALNDVDMTRRALAGFARKQRS